MPKSSQYITSLGHVTIVLAYVLSEYHLSHQCLVRILSLLPMFSKYTTSLTQASQVHDLLLSMSGYLLLMSIKNTTSPANAQPVYHLYCLYLVSTPSLAHITLFPVLVHS